MTMPRAKAISLPRRGARTLLGVLLPACLALALLGAGETARGGQSLIQAAKAGDRAAVLALLREGAEVDARSPDGTTALHWAAHHGDAELVARLIEAGADVTASNDYGVRPVAAAATVGNPGVLRALLAAGGDPDSANGDGQTALMVVARAGNVDAGRVLLEHGAAVNAVEGWRGQTALMWAAAQSRPAMVKLLVENGADADAQAPPTDFARHVSAEPRAQYRPFGGMTALLYAARQGCVECARHLAEAGADLDLPDARGVTPLIMANNNFHFDLAKLLIEFGASPDKWDWWGRTPLYTAVDLHTVPDGGRPDRPTTDRTSGLDVARLLLEAGANPNAQLRKFPPYRHPEDDRGCDRILTIGATPLLRAAKVFDVDSIALLLEHGADVDRPNVNGLTPLMAAAGQGSIECDIRGGPSMLHDNVQQKSIAALELLLAAGADINARDDRERGPYSDFNSRTALHGAAFWGWNDVVEFLVARGARIDLLDRRGLSPVDAAMGRAGGHGRGASIEVFQDTADLLLELCAREPDCNLTDAASQPSAAR
jgi:uncharacterized protein